MRWLGRRRRRLLPRDPRDTVTAPTRTSRRRLLNLNFVVVVKHHFMHFKISLTRESHSQEQQQQETGERSKDVAQED